MKSAEKLKKINLLMDDKLLIKLGLIFFFFYKLIYNLITTIYYTLDTNANLWYCFFLCFNNNKLLQMSFLTLEELTQISPTARTVTIYDTCKSNKCFCATLDLLEENNFQSKLRLKTLNSFIWKLHFSRQKKKVEGRGDISKILDVCVCCGGQKPSVTNL